MAIHAQFRRRYIVGIQNRHKQHKQQVLRIFHKIRSHPACYRPGYNPSRAGVPKSIPRQPAGLTKKAAGFWSTMKKGWSWVKSKFDKHKGAIYEAGKKHATAAAKHVGTRLYDAGKKAGKQVVDRAIQVAERNLEHTQKRSKIKLRLLPTKLNIIFHSMTALLRKEAGGSVTIKELLLAVQLVGAYPVVTGFSTIRGSPLP